MPKNITLFTILFSIFSNIELSAQKIPLNNTAAYYAESKIKFDSALHFTVKPLNVETKDTSLLLKNIKNKILNKILNDNLLYKQDNKYKLSINPIFSAESFYDLSEDRFFTDKKAGISLTSSYKNKLILTTDIFAAQSEFPSFLNYLPEKYGIVPYYGKYNSKDGSEVNYFSWTGDIIFNAGEHIKFSAGRNKFFIGNGYRSLFLSDNSNASPYIKAEINVWKIKYIWTVLKLSDINLSASAVQTYPVKLYDKAAFIHYLSLNITKRINFDFFEAIVTNPYDLDGRRSNYDLTYFNPVIFYRSAEFYEGSSDNSIIGAGLNIRAGKSTFIYSQFILDDLLISSLKDGSGWWGNKFGLQTGIKSYNTLNIKGLFSRFEFNAVRPYTYSHGEAYTTDGIADLNYGSYLQPAAHPSGANFAEGIFEIRYVKKRLSGSLIIILTEKGEDTDSISMGGDIYKSYNLRPSDYGISFLQGEPTDTQIYNLKISYLINPEYNMFFNTGFYYRKEKNDFLVSENSIIYFGITTGIFNSFLD